MAPRADIAARILREHPALPIERPAAAALLQSRGLPDGSGEDWRHANLRGLAQVADFAAPPPVAPQVAARHLPPALAGHVRVVTVDGILDTALSAHATDLARIGATTANDAALPKSGEPLRFALLNALFASQRLQLRIDTDCAVEIVHVATGRASSYPTTQIRVGSNARLALVERFVGGGPNALVCASLDLELQRDARLELDRLQQLDDGTLWLDQLGATLGDAAALGLRSIVTGAASSRSGALVELTGRGAELRWHGLAVAHDQQVHDTLLRVEHRGAQTRMQQVFRGLASGRGRVACNGDMHVTASARGANLTQSLRGLIDGVGAEIDLRPRLEIHTDDIKAAHGATTGQLDETLLFYLLSRGIDRPTASALLKWAFLGEVLGTLRIAELRRAAESAAAGHLSDVLATGALT